MYGNVKEWTHSWYERYDEWTYQVEPIGWNGVNKDNYASDQDGSYSRMARPAVIWSMTMPVRTVESMFIAFRPP